MRGFDIAMPRLLVAAAILAALAGCEGGPFSPSEQRELEAARARWNVANIRSYTVEQRISCFCSPHLNFLTHRITSYNVCYTKLLRLGVEMRKLPVKLSITDLADVSLSYVCYHSG